MQGIHAKDEVKYSNKRRLGIVGNVDLTEEDIDYYERNIGRQEFENDEEDYEEEKEEE